VHSLFYGRNRACQNHIVLARAAPVVAGEKGAFIASDSLVSKDPISAQHPEYTGECHDSTACERDFGDFLYVASAARSAEFYKRVFGFEVIDFDGERLDDATRLCVMGAGDRDVLLLFKRGGTSNTDAAGSIHTAFGISRSELAAWKQWLAEQGIPIEDEKTWRYGGEALYFRDPDRNLLEVVTPGVWSIY